jgi:hypothetical protein
MDFGRKAFLELMASKDPRIRRLIDDGYEFVTNAFTPGAKPPGLRVKDAEDVASHLKKEGYVIELSAAYDETGEPIPVMRSVWRRSREACGA